MRKAIAIDFDGCLCTDAAPEIGDPNWTVINRAKAEQRAGAGLILWTCREGQMLQDAMDACESWGLTFDAVNESLPDWIEAYGNNPRKAGATEYWDDKAVRMGDNPPLTLEELREMDGEPVWVETTDIKKANRYAFVDIGCEVVRFFDTRCGVKCSVMGNHFSTYGKNWFAYRRKPEDR